MKTLSFILLIGFWPVLAEAMPDSLTVQPFEKCNTIIAKTGLSDQEAYKLAGRKLTEAGYSIEQANSDFYSIKSTLTTTKNLRFSYYVLMNVINGNVKLEVIWKNTMSITLWGVTDNGSETKIHYTSSEFVNKQYRDIFPKIIELAKTLNPKELVFEKH